jgi:hypothetical protein
MRWALEYSSDLDPPLWHPQERIEAAPTFEEFEELFREAHDGDPAHGYYRIRLEGSDGGWSIYSWGKSARLLGTRVPIAPALGVDIGDDIGRAGARS